MSHSVRFQSRVLVETAPCTGGCMTALGTKARPILPCTLNRRCVRHSNTFPWSACGCKSAVSAS